MASPLPSLDEPIPFMTAYIRSPSRSASSSRLITTTPRPSPRIVPSPSASNGLALPLGESAGVLLKHIYMKMSLNVSIPPVTTMSALPEESSIPARWSALNELAQAASTTQLVPPRSNCLLIRPATTFPRSPGKEFSCQGT